MRICSGSGCLRTVPDTVRLCDECRSGGRNDNAIKSHGYVADRDRYKALYVCPRWVKRLRPVVLAAFPICTKCDKALSEIVDHIVPAGEAIRQAKESGKYPLNPVAGFFIQSNLTGLCRSCHGRKTNDDKAHVGPWPSIV